MFTVPEGLQDSTQTRAQSIPFQCDEKAFRVHSVIGLPEFQAYQEGGSWYMLAISWVSFNSIISVLVPLPYLNPWRTSCIFRLVWRRVSISASTTFHRVSNRPMPHVLVIPFGNSNRNVHPSSLGISPVCHM